MSRQGSDGDPRAFLIRITNDELIRLIGSSAWRPVPPTISAQILFIGNSALIAARGFGFERCAPILDASLSSDDTLLTISIPPSDWQDITIVLRRDA
jgi:hypothetical protein